VVVCLIGLVMLAVRALEFTALNCSWDSDAYGSIVWMLLGLHTVHLATDVYDTLVLAVLFRLPKPREGKRQVDVSENGMYWYFVVYSWIPIYAVLYLFPRIP
jgi:heme/copper-type cytochrome/quinol oxidase subunit 3